MDDWFDVDTNRGTSLRLALQAVAVFVGVRVLMIPAYLVAWHQQGPNRSSYTSGPPDFFTFLSLSWDGYWYHLIATQGYPSTLPMDPQTGAVAQNAWAFYPLYPFLVRGLMWLGPPFQVASVVVALAMGVAGMVVLAFLVRDAAADAVLRRPGLPLLAVAAMSTFPTGATAMLGYSETTALFLILTVLALIHRRQYLFALIPALLLGFARGVALPLVVVVIWHAVQRYHDSRDGRSVFAGSERIKLVLLTVVALVAGVAWPLIAGMVTGVSDAYLLTQSAWRLGAEATQPFVLMERKLTQWVGPAAWVVLGAAAIAIVVVSLTQPVRRLGPELQAWGGSYLIYIMAVADLGSSVLRFALLSITLPLGLVAWSRKRWIQLAMIVLLLALQVVWINRIWVFTGRGDAFPP